MKKSILIRLNNPSIILAIAILIVTFVMLASVFCLAYPKLFYCTLTFQTNHGTSIEPIKLHYGDSLDTLPLTEREYNTFGGWFWDAEFQYPYEGDCITSNSTLYAKWDTIFDEAFFADYAERLSSVYADTIKTIHIFIDEQEELKDFRLDIESIDLTDFKLSFCIGNSAEGDEVSLFFGFVAPSLEAMDNFINIMMQEKHDYLASGDMSYIRKDVMLLLTVWGNEDTLLGEISETEDFVFAVDEHSTQATLLRYKKDADILVVPQEYNGLPVNTIGAYAFYGKSLSEISLNANLKSIGKHAFAYCGNLTELSIPNGVEVIGNGFIAGSYHINRLELNGAKGYEIDKDALYETKSKTLVTHLGADIDSYVIRDGTVFIGDYAFANRATLTSIVLPQSLLMIYDCSFLGCHTLSEVNFPDSIVEIGVRAFSCSADGYPSALSRIGFGNNSNLTSLCFESFAGNPNLKSIVLPKKLEGIETSAFKNCTGLTHVGFEDGSQMKFIYDGGFEGCTSLTEISLPDSTKDVLYSAFQGCVSLRSVNLNKVCNLYDYAFTDCHALESITFSRDSLLKRIPDFCFENCYSLYDMVLPASVDFIAERAFANCTSLVSINLCGIKELCRESFSGCRSLEEVLFSQLENTHPNVFMDCESITKMTLPSKTSANYQGIFNGLNNLEEISVPLFYQENGNYATINSYFGGYMHSSLKTITINNNVTEIPAESFSHMESVIEINLPDSVGKIGKQAFIGCISLLDINVPTELKVIEERAFEGCISLTDFNLPEGLEVIGDSAFCSNSSLSEVTFPASLKRLENNAYEGCPLLRNVYLPDGMEHVGNNVFADCLDLEEMRVPLDSETTGAPRYPQFLRAYCDSHEFGNKLIKVTLTSDTKVVPSYAFQGLSALEIIDLPQTLQRVDDFAFNNIPKLKKLDLSMTINYGEKLIDEYSALEELTVNMLDVYDPKTPSYFLYFFTHFGGATYNWNQFTLKKLTVSSANISFGSKAFWGAKGLTEIVLPQTLTKISESMFTGAENLKIIDIPSGVTEIGKDAFRYCSSLQEILIPSAVHTLGSNAFSYCTALKKVLIQPNTSLYHIEPYAFAYCISLSDINFPDRTIWQISESMFENCTSLENFDIPQGIQQIAGGAFRGAGIRKISIPSSTISIAFEAFKNCIALEELKFEDIDSSMITSIGREAFYCCRLLEKIIFPKSLNEIVGSAFKNCANLKEVFILHEFNYHQHYSVMCTNLLYADEEDADDGVFSQCHQELKIYVPINNAGVKVDDPKTGAKNGVTAYKLYGIGWGLYANRVCPLPDGFEAEQS